MLLFRTDWQINSRTQNAYSKVRKETALPGLCPVSLELGALPILVMVKPPQRLYSRTWGLHLLPGLWWASPRASPKATPRVRIVACSGIPVTAPLAGFLMFTPLIRSWDESNYPKQFASSPFWMMGIPDVAIAWVIRSPTIPANTRAAPGIMITPQILHLLKNPKPFPL